jgi:hypothetical protein
MHQANGELIFCFLRQAEDKSKTILLSVLRQTIFMVGECRGSLENQPFGGR